MQAAEPQHRQNGSTAEPDSQLDGSSIAQDISDDVNFEYFVVPQLFVDSEKGKIGQNPDFPFLWMEKREKLAESPTSLSCGKGKTVR
jgi:hypothetical protein